MTLTGNRCRSMSHVVLLGNSILDNVVSVDGNETLSHGGLVLHEPASSFAAVLTRLVCTDADDFARTSHRVVRGKRRQEGAPTPPPPQAPAASLGLDAAANRVPRSNAGRPPRRKNRDPRPTAW